LVFGMWDSTGGEGNTLGVKLARALVSEVVGLDAVPGRKTSSRIDPLGITADAAKIYRDEDDVWTLDEKRAKEGKGKRALVGKAGKAGKPSAVNHGNVMPSLGEDEAGGVTVAEAVQTTVLSLPQLRRLRFPDAKTGATSDDGDAAGRTVLAALAL